MFFLLRLTREGAAEGEGGAGNILERKVLAVAVGQRNGRAAVLACAFKIRFENRAL